MGRLYAQLYFPLGDDQETLVPKVAADVVRDLFGEDLLFTDNLQLTSAGDYVLSAGPDNLRRAIRRRLQTKPGEYRLRPDYGVGVGVYVKKAITKALLDELRQKIFENLAQDKRIEKIIDVNAQQFTRNGLEGLKIFVQVKAVGREHAFEPFVFSEDQTQGA